MRISTRLTLAAFVPLIMVIVVGSTLFVSFRGMQGAQQDAQTARLIASASSEMTGFVYSYVSEHQERPREQFLAAQSDIAQTVSGAHMRGVEQQSLLGAISTDNESIRGPFLVLVSSYESGGTVPTLPEQQELLTAQILTASQEMHTDALLLQTLTWNDLKASQKRLAFVTFLAVAIAVVPLTIMLLQTRGSIGRALGRLQRGAQAIGSGDLDHRIQLKQRNELGELAGSFDTMTEMLQEITVSKDALAREIEERKRTESALRESEEKFSSLYMSMVEGVVLYELIYDDAGAAVDALILDVNPAYERLMDMTKGQVVGKQASEVYAVRAQPRLFDMWARVASTGNPESMETYWPPTQKYLSVTAFSRGKSRFANVFYDITERKRAEDALRRNEEKLSSLYMSMAEGVAVGEAIYDGSGRLSDFVLEDVNPAFESAVGFVRDQLVGRRISRVFGTHFPPYLDTCARVLSSREPESFEVYWEPIRRYYRVVIFSPEEHKLAVLLEDTTERKRIEDALRQSEERLRRACQAGRIGLYEWNSTTDVAYANAEAEELFGLESDSPAKFTSWMSTVHPDDLQRLIDLGDVIEHARVGEQVLRREHEYRVIHPDGRVLWLEIKNAIMIEDGDAIVRGAVLDITERRSAEDALKAALSAKDAFLSMVSHEMRTPVTSILGNASLLLDPKITMNDAERRETAETIAEGAKRLASTIDDMLALARIETGRKASLQSLVLPDAIAEIVASHRRRHPDRQVEVESARDLPPVMASREYLTHVMTNLLENAEKYAPSRPIKIKLRRDRGEVTVRVLDRGIGMTADEIEHVFEPFYRSERVAATSHGVGIGLSVCKRLVEEQGGRIWAESAGVGRGSTFEFTLPVGPPGATDPESSLSDA